jgi:rhodanese-related sulfurtransferase
MKLRLLAMTLALGLVPGALAQAPESAKPTIPKSCTNCHQAKPGQIQGAFENVAFKSQSIQLKIDAATEIVRFDEKTLKVVDAGEPKPAEALSEIRKGHEARIEYTEKDSIKTATLISFKGPIKIALEKLVSYAEVEKLVAQSPEKGGYLLVDSRPLPRVQEGTIPTSINLPFTTSGFDKLAAERLPKEKDSPIIFFCQGVTCMLSPNSLRRAEAMGYTNVRVYREGWPEWTQKNVGILAAAHLNEAWLAKDIPHVLIDARPKTEARAGSIKGAVAIGPAEIKAALAKFPDKALKPPIMVYDADGGKRATDVAKAITKAGYPNVNVIPGGFDGWKAAGYPVQTGALGSTVSYAPKPRPGEIAITEFKNLAAKTPAGTLILDVRNSDEANAGMIKGAKLVPDEEILARIAEIPKDKRIVAHCSTGVRAEMAYHKLKEKGYNVAFVKGDIEIDKAGKLTVTPN